MKLRSDDFHQLPLHKACNITSVYYVTCERECLQDSAWIRVKTFVGVTMTFNKVISKLSQWQNFAIIRKNLDSATTTFAKCCHKFIGLKLFELVVFWFFKQTFFSLDLVIIAFQRAFVINSQLLAFIAAWAFRTLMKIFSKEK